VGVFGQKKGMAKKCPGNNYPPNKFWHLPTPRRYKVESGPHIFMHSIMA
jgi:hypothetical protein